MVSSIQILRSTTSQERPLPGNLLEGQPAVNINATEPGLFFKASDGSIVKFGPVAITSDGSPPNSSAQGSTGNSVGELWLDKSISPAVLKVYDGATWVEAGSGGGGGSGGFVRWIYTAAGGETSLSGTSGGVLLTYTPGLEEVFVNGVLITRGSEYSAVNGSSVTNLSPLAAGDVVTVTSLIPLQTVQLPGQVTLLRWSILASSGQTLLSGADSSSQQLAYTAGLEEVYVNGIFLRRGLDYTATSGTTITLASPLSLDDEVSVMAWSPFNVSDFINSSSILFTQNGSGAVERTVQSKLSESVSLRDFGVLGDGTDETQKIQDALDSGAKVVHAPAGTYRIDGSLIIPTNVSLIGEGANVTIFDGSQANEGRITNNSHILTADCVYSILPSLSANIEKNSRTITFTSSPNVQSGDIIVIYDPNDFSWSGSRFYYRAGEYIRVASVSGNTVEVQGSICDSYLASAVDVYRVDNMTTCHLKNFSLIGKPDSPSPLRGLTLRGARDSSVEDVRVSRVLYTSLSVERCFNTQLRHCTCEENFLDEWGGEYGLAIINSHIVNVTGGYFVSNRHGLTIGGGTGIGRVPNRYLTINGAYIGTTGGSQAADIHGNAEYVTYSDCVIDGGSTMGGDYCTIDNCQLRGKQQNGPVVIYISEARGLNFHITNNTLQNDQVAPNRGAMIDLGGNSFGLGNATYRGGEILVHGNTMIWEAPSVDNSSAFTFVNRGYAGSEPISVTISDNKIIASKATDNGSLNSVRNAVSGGRPFDQVMVSNLVSIGAGGFRVGPDTNIVHAKDVRISGCYITKSSNGITTYYVSDSVSIENNICRDVGIIPIASFGLSSNKTRQVIVSNNTALDSNYGATSSSTTNTPLAIFNAQTANVFGNTSGSSYEMLYVGSNTNFLVGETITSSSGGTATVSGFFGATTILIRDSRSGSFNVGNTVTGGTSGATTSVSSPGISSTQRYSASYLGIDTLLLGQNTHVNPGLSEYKSGITQEVSTFIAEGYTTSQRDALAAPRAGVIIFNSTTSKLNFYNGSSWETVTST